MRLTLGPVLFHWPADQLVDFYARIADEAPVDRVVIGEAVCSKRSPFYEWRLPEIAERLDRAGKEVVFASLALVTTKRERRAEDDLAKGPFPVEVNDLSMLKRLPPKTPFSVGPLINTYNESTLAFLAERGASAVCLPPELPLASVEILAGAGARRGVSVEAWAFGRIPLAISARCYHARLTGRSKDSCQFVCGEDPDGLAAKTIDGAPFLAVNGVQTLSERFANLVGDTAALKAASVDGLRLSPHTGDMVRVAQIFRDAVDETEGPDESLARMAGLMPDRRFSNGFLLGATGASWTHA